MDSSERTVMEIIMIDLKDVNDRIGNIFGNFYIDYTDRCYRIMNGTSLLTDNFKTIDELCSHFFMLHSIALLRKN